MNILKLQILVLIDKYHKVTEVAQSLKLKQPTVSFHMKKMEQELGVRLFEIGRGRTSLTGAGKVLLSYAKQITTLESSARQALKDYTTQHATLIRVAAEDIPGNFILPTLIANYSGRYPAATVKLMVQTRENILSMLAAGEVDIGFTHEQPDASLGLSSSIILEDEIGIIQTVNDHTGKAAVDSYNREHRATEDQGREHQTTEHSITERGIMKSPITEQWIEEQMKADRLIVQDASSQLGQFTQRWCEYRELSYNAGLEMNSTQALAGMVQSANLISFYPRIASSQLPQAINWQAISTGQGTNRSPLYRYQVWMHNRTESLTPAGEQLTALINEWSKQRLEQETVAHPG